MENETNCIDKRLNCIDFLAISQESGAYLGFIATVDY